MLMMVCGSSSTDKIQGRKSEVRGSSSRLVGCKYLNSVAGDQLHTVGMAPFETIFHYDGISKLNNSFRTKVIVMTLVLWLISLAYI